ncbi:MerR family transcriptional regulator [Methylobacterium sp. J-048]|uniref:MerR family transcriptional regulator n=1 Tax=Methylobacterium sp. J-048 TaxID=2836635 RepID=UPI001FBA019A|nr:MerR family transcriptional regulator [Methylobacterium sp. J-048]MCJ2056644.1 MerR family transcriptional regulator [Methylobacterium sp. J-048]
MRIGELARRTGVSVRMLRFYEQEGLLRPPRRESGQRDYSDDDARQVRRIRALNTAGLTLRAIRIVLPCVKREGQGFRPCAGVRATLERERDRIVERLEVLESGRATLQSYLDALEPGQPD